ncbi:hypothetical protein, partial [Thiolapillus sp.]|uniref:hypothetical protein n=1 Tax=Thiolapillus sp. TaxID=2017437 RepID=UPI003AF4ECC4
MTRTAGAPMGCQRPSRFWGLGCPKIYHEAEDTLARFDLYICHTLTLTGNLVSICALIWEYKRAFSFSRSRKLT